MATYKKTNTGWEAQVSIKGKRASKTLKTKARAQAWAVEKEQELSELADGRSHTHTLRDVFDRYAEEISEKKKSGAKEIVRLKALSKMDIAGMRLYDLRLHHFDDFVKLRLKTVKPSSVNRELNLVSHCLTCARRWRWMTHEPMKDLERPKDPRPRDRRISNDEIEQIKIGLNYSEEYEVTQKQQHVCIAFLLAIETAMRAGEICGIMPEHINYRERTVFLPETKNGYPRTVPLSKEAMRLLKRLPATQGPVFQLASGTLTNLFRKGMARTTIKDLRFHDTRHEGTTRLAAKLQVLDLARVTGHRDINMLMTYYNKNAADLAKELD